MKYLIFILIIVLFSVSVSAVYTPPTDYTSVNFTFSSVYTAPVDYRSVNFTLAETSDALGTCDCPPSGNWTISDGTVCDLTVTCDITPNFLLVDIGGFRIGSSGSLIAKGVFVADSQPFFVLDSSKFFVTG